MLGPMELLILCFVLVFAIKFVNRRSNRKPTRGTERAMVGPAFSPAILPAARAVASCWLAPTGVMALFVALSGAAIGEWDQFWLRNDQLSVADVKNTNRTNTVVTSSIESETTTNASPQNHDQERALDRPKWTSDGEGETTSGDVTKVVLSSRLWSTEAEAIRELQAKLAEIVRADFEQRHHGPFDPRGYRFLADDQISDAAVKERYVERIEQDFGKFSSPMNRVWWQVELSPLVRTELYPAWNTVAIQNRVIAVGSALALLTLFGNVISLFTKRLKAPNGSTVSALAVSSASVLPWMAIELFVASRLMA